MKCPDELLLNRYLEDQLSPEEKGEIEAHLEKCADCRLVVELEDDALPQTSSYSQEPISEKQTRAKPNNEYLALLGRGDSIGRYIVIERIGQGAMGVVYSAYDPQLDRKVALKVVRPDDLVGVTDENASTRLLREGQAMARVVHTNVVSVFDVVEVEEDVVIAMEFVDGVNLTAWLRKEQRSWREVVDVFLRAGRGLEAAHEAGLVHRDFKPANVLLSKTGRVCVSDFGLAKGFASDQLEPDGEASSGPTASPSLLESPLTRTGGLAGTPGYMAPEQLEGKIADERSDQFSFCVALYEALYGNRPFQDDLEINKKEGHPGVATSPKPNRAPSWLKVVVLRGLKHRPEDRYPSLNQLLADLGRIPWQRRRRNIMIGLGLMTFVLLVVAIMIQTPASTICQGAERHLASVWNPSLSTKLREVFVASGRSYAQDTFHRVRKHLGDWAKGWVDMHTQACKATHVDGTQSEELLDLRMACLKRKLDSLGGLVSVLSETPDANVLDRAVEASLKLGSIVMCADGEALSQAVLPPEDPKVRIEVDKLSRQLDLVLQRGNLGQYLRSTAILVDLIPKAQRLDYPPVMTRIFLLHGQLQQRLGKYKEAEMNLKKALQQGLHLRLWDYALSAGQELVGLVGGIQHRPAEGLAYAQTVFGLSQSRGDKALAKTSNTLGALYLNQGKFDKAEENFLRAQALYKKALGTKHPTYANLVNNLGVVYNAQGKQKEAKNQLRHVIQIWDEMLGPDHLHAASSRSSLAYVLEGQGLSEEAEPLYQRALKIQEKALGADNPKLVRTLNGLASVYYKLKKYEDSESTYRRSLAVLEKSQQSETFDASWSYQGLATILNLRGQPIKALQLHRQALSIREKLLGPKHPWLSWPLSGLGLQLLELKQYSKARQILQRGVRICEKSSCDPGVYADCLFGLARVLWKSPQDHKQAIQLAKKAQKQYGLIPGAKEELTTIKRWLKMRQG